MGSRKAVLSVPRTLDMVPLGEILQGRSNQGVKALSDNSDRYISDSGILKRVFPPNWKKAWSSGEPTPAWSNNEFDQGVKFTFSSPMTSVIDCSPSNNRYIYVQINRNLSMQDSGQSRWSHVEIVRNSGERWTTAAQNERLGHVWCPKPASTTTRPSPCR